MDLEEFLNKNKDTLIYFSPYRFIRKLDPEYLVDLTVIEPLLESLEDGSMEVITITEESAVHHFLIQKLVWDTDYFGFSNYKILNVLFDHADLHLLSKAVRSFKREFCIEPGAYYYLDLPHEAVLLCQAFTANGFRMVENRMNLYFEGVQDYNATERYRTRLASGTEDARMLQRVGREMRNPFDRFHAEAMVDNSVADNYIGQYAYNSVMGLADFVIVPDLLDTPPFGFFSAKKPTKVGSYNVSPLVLAAIDNRKYEKGWLIKLISELTYILKDHQVDIMTTITQTSNAPAYKTYEKFGFKLGFFTAILVYKNQM